MQVRAITKDDWATLAERAHLIVFNEIKKPEMDRIDFALIVENESSVPLQYATCRELDAESLYLQYGGSFPGTKGTIKSIRCFNAILDWANLAGYRRVSFLVENTNEAMLKLALSVGFLIIGVRNYRGLVLLEHAKEFPPHG